jgi:hypothetical protein
VAEQVVHSRQNSCVARDVLYPCRNPMTLLSSGLELGERIPFCCAGGYLKSRSHIAYDWCGRPRPQLNWPGSSERSWSLTIWTYVTGSKRCKIANSFMYICSK